MSRNGFFEGIREVGRDPALVIIEIGWRWSFGAIAVLIAAFSAYLILDRIALDPRRLQAMAALNPLQLAQYIVEGMASIHTLLWRVALLMGLVLSSIWILFSALGRYATLARPALNPGASLPMCFVVSALRAMLTLAGVIAWFFAGLFAAAVGSSATRDAMPNFGIMSAILFLAFLVIVSVWSTLNWFLSLVPLRNEPTLSEALLSTLAMIRSRRDELLEISIVSGIVRAALFGVAILLSVAAGSVITNARMLLVDLLAISLLYFLIADFLYVAKFVAFGKLRGEALAQPASAVLSPSDVTMIGAT